MTPDRERLLYASLIVLWFACLAIVVLNLD